MTVYVDDLRSHFGRMRMCHMIADTDAELHAMAERIEVSRRCHRTPGRDSQYDLSPEMRARAVAAGAVEIPNREAGCMTVRRRITGQLGRPRDAKAWVREHLAAARAAAGPGIKNGNNGKSKAGEKRFGVADV